MQTIDNKIIEWFDKYHEWETVDSMTTLYETLVDEEITETFEAMFKWDVAETFDWLWDVYWVTLWARYYYSKSNENNAELICDKYYSWLRLIKKFMWEKFELIMEEIIKSNNSKVIDSQSNWKIKKWPNFVKPNILFALWLNNWTTN